MGVQVENNSWQAGHQLKDGEYTIERKLPGGGFNDIYIAKNTKLQDVAIKIIKKEVHSEYEFEKIEENFIKEAINLARCEHHYIVPYKDIFKTSEGWCLVMDYIEGKDLHLWVKENGCLSHTEALRYIRQIGQALKVIHNQGLLHRDVKPRNIIRRANGSEAVLIDLGISRQFSTNKIEQHTPLLTENFAPIEQYREKYERGAYTDVYALAATLYYLLTGKAPTPSIARSEEALIPLRELNPEISHEVEKAIILGMQMHPKERPQTIQAWLDLLPKGTTESSLSHEKRTELISETKPSVANSQNPPLNDLDPEWMKQTQAPINPLPKRYNQRKLLSNIITALTSPVSFLTALAIVSYLGTTLISTGFWLVLIVVLMSVLMFIFKEHRIKQLSLLFISSVMPTLLIFLCVPALRVPKPEQWGLLNLILILGLLSIVSSLLGWALMNLFRQMLAKQS